MLALEIQLLQKSKSPRPKDEADFLAAHGQLGPEQREWLVRSLALTSPTHHWLSQL